MPDVATPDPISQPQVLIVGAGPVGLTAAAELARHGVRPRVIDSLPAPTDQPRAVIVHSRTQDLLERTGVLSGMLPNAEPQRYIQISTVAKGTDQERHGPRTLATFDLGNLPGRHQNMLSIPQPQTEAALRERVDALGIRVERGVTLTNLRQDSDAVAVTLDGPAGREETSVDWVIGADGARSAVRGFLDIALDRAADVTCFVIADVLGTTDLPTDTTQLFVGRSVSIMLPMRAGRFRIIFQIDRPDGAAHETPTIDELRDLIHHDMADALKVDSAPWASYYTIRHGQVPRYRSGRVFLSGDAAHIHSPAGGQGLNTGVQDAGNLAWKLALVCRGLADPSLLDSYQDERHPIGAAVVRNTSALTEIMTAQGLAGTVRNAALWSIGHHTWSADKLATQLAELTIAYPHSPVVHTETGRTLLAGHYAPDVVLCDTTGKETAIADLLSRPGHLLLVTSTDAGLVEQLRRDLGDLGSVVPIATDPSRALTGSLLDPERHLQAEYGLSEQGIALIRPDGYVGYIDSRDATPGKLAAYLRRLTQPGSAHRARPSR